MKYLDGITNSMDMSLSSPGDNERQGSLACCMGSQRVGHDLATEQPGGEGGEWTNFIVEVTILRELSLSLQK